MALWSYLNAYLSSIPASQRQRLLNLLYTRVQSTQIKSVADYEAQFQTDIAKLNADPTAPVFKLRSQNYRDITSSANFNDMENNAINSLKTLYQEAVLLEDAVSNHVSVVDADLASIEATVDDINKQVTQLELLASNTNGFVTSVYDSFNVDNSNRLTRTSSTVNLGFFIDPKLGFIQPAFDATIENGSLRLPIQNTLHFNINSATVENQDPIGISTLEQIAASGVITDTQQLQYSLADLLSPQTSDRYWAETVDVPSLVDASGNPILSAETDLVLGVAGIQQINRITIDPFSRYPYTITNIEYTKNALSDTWHQVPITFPVTVEALTPIDLPNNIYADKLKLHIRQNNYSALRYTTTGVTNTIDSLYNVATGNQFQPPESLTNPDTYYYAMTNNMQNLLGINTTLVSDTTQVNVYEFMYGMKSIALQQLRYANLGLYVSKPFRIESPGAIGLDVIESIPQLTAIQYRAIVNYKDIVDGQETGTSVLETNILPGQAMSIADDVYPEILDGSDNTVIVGQWSGFTRFPLEWVNSTTPTKPFVVKQNGISIAGTFNLEQQADNTARVWFYSGNNANRNISTFTVSYTPLESARVVDLERHDVAYITLQVLLRSISPNPLLTPFVTSYSMKFKKFGSL